MAAHFIRKVSKYSFAGFVIDVQRTIVIAKKYKIQKAELENDQCFLTKQLQFGTTFMNMNVCTSHSRQEKRIVSLKQTE